MPFIYVSNILLGGNVNLSEDGQMHLLGILLLL